MTTVLVHRPDREVRRAFTLIELLVSMTVLTVLILAVSQIVSGTTSLSTANRQHLDADSQARLVFDRMALDFDRMLKRRDVDYVFKDSVVSPQTGGDDRFFFYTEAPAFFYTSPGSSPPPASIQSPLSLVGYRVNSKDQKYPYQLSRLGKGLDWDESNATAQSTNGEPVSIAYLTPASTPSASPTPTPDAATTLPGRWPVTVGAAPDYAADDTDPAVAGSYHVIADQVCRMEICFLLKPRPASSTLAAQPARYSVDPYYDAPGTANSLHASINGMQDVQAIVVALAVLDRSSRQIAPDLSKIKTVLRDIAAADLTATAPAAPTLMAKIWQDAIDGNKLVTEAGLPHAAAAQMRVYQRYFYLDTH